VHIFNRYPGTYETDLRSQSLSTWYGIYGVLAVRTIAEHSYETFANLFLLYPYSMSAAVGMLPPPPSPATSIAYINNASDDILSRCRKTLDLFTTLAFRVLALQQDPTNSLASSLRSTMSTTRETGSTIGNAESAAPTSLDRLDMNLNLADGAKDMNGTFDVLQDMQVDMSGWSFPDFWAFDLGGDF
jgi:hypothetical protein